MKGINVMIKNKKNQISRETAFACLKNYISGKQKGADFVDIEMFFNQIGFDYKGTYYLFFINNPSVIAWQGWNMDAINVVERILEDKNFKLALTPGIIYNFKGFISKYPVVEGKDLKQKYDTFHWAPLKIVFKTNYSKVG